MVSYSSPSSFSYCSHLPTFELADFDRVPSLCRSDECTEHQLQRPLSERIRDDLLRAEPNIRSLPRTSSDSSSALFVRPGLTQCGEKTQRQAIGDQHSTRVQSGSTFRRCVLRTIFAEVRTSTSQGMVYDQMRRNAKVGSRQAEYGNHQGAATPWYDQSARGYRRPNSASSPRNSPLGLRPTLSGLAR